MRYAIFTIGLLLAGFFSFAQAPETIRVSAGDDVAAAVSAYGMYRFPAFMSATISLRDGSAGAVLINYNILNDQVMYIDVKGDTLAIANPADIKEIAIGNINLYYSRMGYVEEVAATATASLVLKRKVSLHTEKEGAFGIPSAATSIDSYSTYTFNRTSYHLVVKEDVVLKKSFSYYLRTGDNNVVPATKTGFLQVFSANKAMIEKYLSDHKVNFRKEEDLVSLFNIAAVVN